jgi:uncharacterized protein (TIGR00369 family)
MSDRSEGRDRFADAPVSRLVGFDVLPGPVGKATVVIDCDTRHHNPMGRVHGGVIAALADAAMGIAFARTLSEDQDFSTIEMKVNFIRPVVSGRLEAIAKVFQRGLRIGFIDCQILNARGKCVATATSTCTVITEG